MTRGARFPGAFAAVHDVESVGDLGELISERIGRVAPHDGYMLFGLDPITGVGCFHASRHGYRDESTQRFLNAYVLDTLNGATCPFQTAIGSRVRVLTAGSAEARPSARLREVIAQGYGSEIRLGLTSCGVVWGGLVLLRELRSRPFSAAEAVHAECLAEPLGATLRQYVAGRALCPASPVLPQPGVVIVGMDNAIKTATKSGREWLAALDCVLADEARIGGALWSIAGMARFDAARAFTRVPTPDGWLSVHAQCLGDEADCDVVITLQPASAAVLLPAVAAWYGLTRKETAVVELALKGLAAKQIARRLDVSPYTVNDHFKAIYRKTGVTGRDELLASLLA